MSACFVNVPDDYNLLASILSDALHQASRGKGLARHADAREWEQQVSGQIARSVGVGYPVGQAMKKLAESVRLLNAGAEPERAESEVLGAIVYAALAIAEVRRAADVASGKMPCPPSADKPANRTDALDKPTDVDGCGCHKCRVTDSPRPTHCCVCARMGVGRMPMILCDAHIPGVVR